MSHIEESVGIGGVHSCGCKECYTKNGGKDTKFKSYADFLKHVESKQQKVVGSTICKYCKERYEYGNRVIEDPESPGRLKKIRDKDEDRPTVKIVNMGEAMHPECKIKYFEEQGLEVKKK
ncbi:MAG: hypothetical protein R3321_02595 [Nitrososphaeraceae archaeon]|nr:hypothetical protein [Nitrososphaeraceae archaeon]